MNSISLSLKLLTVAAILLQKETQHRLNSSRRTVRHVYDYIVVGSGSAGAVVAHRLAEDRRTSVLVIEAGLPPGVLNDIPGVFLSLENSQYDWNYTMDRQLVGLAFQDQKIIEYRGFVLGGSSSINGMVYNRGNRKDYDLWSQEFGAQGWSFNELFPYFLKFENNTDPQIVANGWHSTSGPVQISSYKDPDPILQVWKQATVGLGYRDTDINGPVQVGTAFAQSYTDSKSVRTSTANAYLDPNPFPKNLHILTRALVTRVLFNGKTAVGVEYVKEGKAYRSMVRKEVIVSAGVINSPQLLMLSGIGPAGHLAQFGIPVMMDLPVGDNLQNHVASNMFLLIKPEYQNLATSGDVELTIDKLYEYYVNHSGQLARANCGVHYFNTRSNDNKDWPNAYYEARALRFPGTLDDLTEFKFGERKDQWSRYFDDFYGQFFLTFELIIARIRSHGILRLRSNNPFVYPSINPKFLIDPRDFEDFVEILKFLFYMYERTDIANYVVAHRPIPGCQFCPNQSHIYECDSYIRCFVVQFSYTGYHTVGTCRMGDHRRPDTVVDPLLRVKGISGLRVCDASIMPSIPNGNTNAAAIVIGEKCADLIRRGR